MNATQPSHRSGPLASGRPAGGFTLIELLVVIAIIGVLMALLLPAVQAAREAVAQAHAVENVKALSFTIRDYREEEGAFPEELTDLIEFCKRYPALCDQVDADILATTQDEGYWYFIDPLPESRVRIGAEPAYPGRTGSTTVTEELGLEEGEYVSRMVLIATPGADAGREAMFASLRKGAARTLSALFLAGPAARFLARDHLDDEENQADVADLLDRVGNGEISLLEVYEWPGEYAQRFDGIDPELAEPVLGFIELLRRETKIDTTSEAFQAEVSISRQSAFAESLGTGFFGLAELCRLTELLASDDKVARSLCLVLKKAEDALLRGDFRAAEKYLADYRQGVGEETHLALTDRDAVTLAIWLTVGFFEVVDEVPMADLALEKSASTSQIMPGDTFDYTLTVSNQGPNTAQGIVLEDRLPDGLILRPGSACELDGALICTLDRLEPGTSAEWLIPVQAEDTAAGDPVNTAVVSSLVTLDANEADNTAEAKVSVVDPQR